MTKLADGLALRPVGDNEWRAFADPRFEAGTGMFGGWTAALLLQATRLAAPGEGAPVAVGVSYVSKISTGVELAVRASAIGGGRSLSHWRAEAREVGGAALGAVATVLLAKRRDSDGFTEGAAPAAPPPEELPCFHPPAPFGARVDVRPVSGFPPFNRPDTRSLSWVREMTGRRLDAVQLAYLADCFPPRILYRSEGMRASSTLTMSVYFHATEEELAAIGDDFVLSEVAATRAAMSTIGSRLSLWSRGGALLATSEQLCWHR
jgi:acyl-CoA thioesterase